jgi:hypothetical protein
VRDNPTGVLAAALDAEGVWAEEIAPTNFFGAPGAEA